MPQAASLFYASDDALNLYWVSVEKSRHSQNLERVAHVAVSIHHETWDWRDIHGVQIEGVARRLSDPDDTDRAWALFRDKFPFTSEFTDQIAQQSVLHADTQVDPLDRQFEILRASRRVHATVRQKSTSRIENLDKAALRGEPSHVWRFGQNRRLDMIVSRLPIDTRRILSRLRPRLRYVAAQTLGPDTAAKRWASRKDLKANKSASWFMLYSRSYAR